MTVAMLMEIVRQRRRSLTILVLLIAIAVGLVVLRITWQEPRLAQLQHQWFASRELAAGVASSPATVYGKGKEDLQRVREFTPPRTRFVALLEEMYETAANNHLTVEEMTYKPEAVTDKAITAYGLTLKVTGSYAAVKSFIADLERMRELVVIDGLDIVAEKDSPGGLVTMKLPFSAYFLTEA
jgi:type IV pilus assembly protein PilO